MSSAASSTHFQLSREAQITPLSLTSFLFSKRPIFFILVGSYDLDIIDIVISPPHLRLDLLQLRLQRLTIAVRKRVQALRRVRRGRLEHHNQWNMMEHYSQSLGT